MLAVQLLKHSLIKVAFSSSDLFLLHSLVSYLQLVSAVYTF